jgi:adenosine deaminase CECR1
MHPHSQPILTEYYRSRLSHDFYQVMAGKSDMTLHGLRQLVEWSIEHSCMEPELMKEVREDWEKKWTGFCQRIVDGEFNFKDDGSELRAAGGDGGP